MRSIKRSAFITIDSGEQPSFELASDILRVKANDITKSLGNIMPVKLIKVETISFDREVYKDKIMNETKQFWLATGLMIKL